MFSLIDDWIDLREEIMKIMNDMLRGEEIDRLQSVFESADREEGHTFRPTEGEQDGQEESTTKDELKTNTAEHTGMCNVHTLK